MLRLIEDTWINPERVDYVTEANGAALVYMAGDRDAFRCDRLGALDAVALLERGQTLDDLIAAALEVRIRSDVELVLAIIRWGAAMRRFVR